ncbi:uncharacterized protein B0I36DRAFT_108506 [Microdochium trichocladiopsis]|uniref:Uncharacterized protein n=1 Tax=Microdochium trichocladiopsis TaxID=1682393 RepID=A0A9P8Y9E2_9PEZI|nr:uncharacterized protein B0I36DRAFT_108506 [Microdochium trichocladiopsis]KAH7033393.1 hypothetical protein B0I36DRAFT_108506 [Microdochium trichocladiopsis]
MGISFGFLWLRRRRMVRLQTRPGAMTYTSRHWVFCIAGFSIWHLGHQTRGAPWGLFYEQWSLTSWLRDENRVVAGAPGREARGYKTIPSRPFPRARTRTGRTTGEGTTITSYPGIASLGSFC